MPDSHSPVGLFKGEMAEVSEDQGQLLFVIGTPGRLPRSLHQNNSQIPRIFPGKRAYLIGQLIVGDKKPAPPFRVRLPFRQFFLEIAHGIRFLNACILGNGKRASPYAEFESFLSLTGAKQLFGMSFPRKRESSLS
jgi:hypothetical protein